MSIDISKLIDGIEKAKPPRKHPVDLLLDDLHAGGETLLERMAALCGWDPRHYLEFDAGRDGE